MNEHRCMETEILFACLQKDFDYAAELISSMNSVEKRELLEAISKMDDLLTD